MERDITTTNTLEVISGYLQSTEQLLDVQETIDTLFGSYFSSEEVESMCQESRSNISFHVTLIRDLIKEIHFSARIR